MNNFRVVLLLFVVGLSGCASQSALQHNLPIAEPAQVRFAYEIELGKLNEFLRQDLPAEQLGELLYRRGALYDALGLRTLARVDFNHALEYAPRLANAYNYLGIHYTVMGEYQYAYDAFDSVLELEPEHGYALLNRGLRHTTMGAMNLPKPICDGMPSVILPTRIGCCGYIWRNTSWMLNRRVGT